MTSRATSLPEAAGDAALYVDAEDVSDIRQGLMRLVTDEDLRACLRSEASAQSASFSWNSAATRTIACYERAIAMEYYKGSRMDNFIRQFVKPPQGRVELPSIRTGSTAAGAAGFSHGRTWHGEHGKGWDLRARTHARYFIDGGYYQTEEEFDRSGARSLETWILRDIGLDKQAAVLEIGCGIGRVLKPLAGMVREVHGVDVSVRCWRKGRSG